MIHNEPSLAEYGWTQFFQAQLDLDELDATLPARVLAAHRGALDVAQPAFSGRVSPPPGSGNDDEARPTVGDWLLLDRRTKAPTRMLTRHSLFKRRAAGTGRQVQLIAANIDTLFVVTSCNREFNPARLERYLALAREAEVTPVIVLSKADRTDDAQDFANRAAALLPGLPVECLDARDPDETDRLRPWCDVGQTVALVGSSGVGKSTLINTLIGQSVQDTAAIREDDARGRHTTRGRSMHRLPTGGWIVDTPGMRALQVADVDSGLDDVFAEIATLAANCHFNDCQHDGEPGCAVQAGIAAGHVTADRLRRYRKLLAEDAFNTSSLAERHARGRAFGKMVKQVTRHKSGRRQPWARQPRP